MGGSAKVYVALKTLFVVMTCIMAAALVYLFAMDRFASCFNQSDWWIRMAECDVTIYFLLVVAWFYYKELNWIKTLVFTVVIIFLGSFATCAYIVLQLYKLSPEESSKDPIYYVLARRQQEGDVMAHTRQYSVPIAKAIIAICDCYMLGVLICAIIFDGSPFQVQVLTPCMITSFFDIHIHIVVFSLWIAYKESDWINAVVWILLLISFRSFALSVYVIRELFYLSPEQPLSRVLFNQKNRDLMTNHVSKSDYFVALMGTWIPTSTKLLIISVYAPQELSEKRDLWDYLHLIINRWDGETVIMGDFNEVRSERERFGSVFNQQGTMVFNNFISSTGLIDLPLDGYAFTWSHKSASKMSKLDRFLLSEGLMELFPHLSAICLDKNLSDHRPILLRETSIDYGPSPFRFFHSWFTMEGFDSFVENTWNSFNIGEANGLIRLKKKLQFLKIAIKAWTKEAKMKSNEKKFIIQQNLLELDKLIDQGRSNEEILCKRIMLINDLHEINSKNASELSQKAKIRWSIEGDENSKYFHGILNKRRSQLAIRGVLVDGDWISDPSKVKDEFFNHFKKQFSPPQSSRICFDYVFPTRLSSDQVEELERDVSYDEVKGAVWDCGTNKSPGPDGFSFEFYRKYWSFIDQDIFMAVKDFFMNGCFPRGCNSSFIALILKIQDAKFVDFEKAFDSVKWDYLDETLKAFGFGQKWCTWIGGCLKNAMGSVLVNGNPSSEFQFFKGLKQGDPLSHFLFILIMETLHLSFMRILNAGLYKGISLNDSFTISHLFYADDVVFVAEWNDTNIYTLLNVLKCFYVAPRKKSDFSFR
ncbi:RNA-directed DNA polymerase, eukaryota [Tanacetum coccineum]